VNKKSLPYVKGSATSKSAAESMVTSAESIRQRIRDFIYMAGSHGATADEVQLHLGLTHQTASARVSELANKFGHLKDSGKTRATRSKRQAVVYVFNHENK
jgi:hypothetical protein